MRNAGAQRVRARQARAAQAPAHQGPVHQDPGLQPERTLLSWTRTLMLMLVVGGFFIRWAPYHGAAVLWLFGAAALTSAGVWAGQRRRYARAGAGIAAEQYPPALGGAAALAAAVTALGGVALVLVLL